LQLSSQDFAEIVTALHAAETGRTDQRLFPRTQVMGRVVVTPAAGGGAAGAPYAALTRDLSFRGAGLLQASPAQVAMSVTLTLPRKGKPALNVPCRVMHVRPVADGLYAVGCQFEAPVASAS
jgi:hypothetical protein